MRWRRNGAKDAARSDVDGSGDAAHGHAQAAPTESGRPAASAAAPAARAPIPPSLPDLPLDTGVLDPDELARAIRRAVARAMAEDLGDRGDVTSLATVDPTQKGVAELVARADGVFAGRQVAEAVFDQVDARIEVSFDVEDGERVRAGQSLATVSGPLRSILTAERTALNFVGHLSGIATRTREVVDLVEGSGVAIRDTRKTTPGLRLLEKHAVLAGGGHNHRIGLHDALLVKDNHVAAAGSIVAAARAALDRSRGRHVQVEVTSIGDIDAVLELGIVDVLLDNFTPDEARAAVEHVNGRARLEASGTITLDDVRAYAATGVDRIAMGSITHSAPWLDIALDVRSAPRESNRDRFGSLDVAETASTTVPASILAPDEPADDDAAQELPDDDALASESSDADAVVTIDDRIDVSDIGDAALTAEHAATRDND